MKDREFLLWLCTRLVTVHGEPENIDYVHKLAAIAKATPADQRTPNTGDFTAPAAACSCWDTMDSRLQTKGFKISDSCSALIFGENRITVQRYLPLKRVDGKALKRADAKGIHISFCPFCGRPFTKGGA